MLVYEYSLEHLRGEGQSGRRFRERNINPTHTVIAGSLAGMASWTPAVPFDVVKTRMMTEPDPKRFRGVWHCLRVIHRVRRIEEHLSI